MLEDVTIDTFQPHVGTSFTVELPGGDALSLLLSEVHASATDDDSRRKRAPFSLIFRPPAGRMILQGTYRIDGAAGAMELFLVPIVPDRDGPRIQAVFT